MPESAASSPASSTASGHLFPASRTLRPDLARSWRASSSRPLVWKLLAAVGLLLLAQGVLWEMRRDLSPAEATLTGLDLEQWPLQLPPWQGVPSKMAVEVVKHSAADAMGNWLYRNRLGEQVLVHVGVWTDYQTSLPHPPELCYAGSGWRLVERKEVPLELPNRTNQRVARYQFQRADQKLLVLAWYQFGEETILDQSEVRGMLQRVRSGSRQLPPAIKVMLQTRADDPVRAEEQLLHVARLLRLNAAALQPASPTADAPAGK